MLTSFVSKLGMVVLLGALLATACTITDQTTSKTTVDSASTTGQEQAAVAGPANLGLAVLDNFNRPDGALGPNWSGAPSSYAIAANQLRAGSDAVYWSPATFGPDQAAFVTLTNINTGASEIDVLLKSQSAASWKPGVLEAWYDPANKQVKVVSYADGQGWVERGAPIPVTFVNGDVFGARATAAGQVEIYQNATLLGARDVTAWPYNASGGYIGLWFINASGMTVDDFGGGGVNAAPTAGASPTNVAPTAAPTHTVAPPTVIPATHTVPPNTPTAELPAAQPTATLTSAPPTPTTPPTSTHTAAPTTSAPTALAAATNLLTNGGFEAGNLAGWDDYGGITVVNSPSIAFTGNWGAKMPTDGRIDQRFTTVVGQTYYVSARVRLDQQLQASTWGGIRVQIVNSSWQELGAYIVDVPNSPLGQWTRVSFSFVANTTQSRLIYQRFSDGLLEATADDFIVSMTLPSATPTVAAPTNTHPPSASATASRTPTLVAATATRTPTRTPTRTQTPRKPSRTPARTATPTASRTLTALPATATASRTATSIAPTNTAAPATSTYTPIPATATAVAPTATHTSPAPTATSAPAGSLVTFPVGPGGADVVPHQIVRTNTDRVYLFVSQNSSNLIRTYYTANPGLPNASTDFVSGPSLTEANGNPVSVDAVYDGGSFIYLLVNTTSGMIKAYPFNVSQNAFVAPITLASDGAIVNTSDLYVGTSGLSGMMDTTGALHLAYWQSGNHIVYVTYTASAGALTPAAGPTVLDTAGAANHPSLAVSPADNSVTVAWISEAGATQVLARTRRNGAWGAVETVSNTPLWKSTNFGINVDQGSSLLISADGARHLVYIENFDATGDYGRIHYVTSNGAGWVDTPLANYTHDPALALNATGDLFIVGHGHPRNAQSTSVCLNMTNMCYMKKSVGGAWGQAQLIVAAEGAGSFDASPSVKWSVVGFNRPETAELVFFSIQNGDYMHPTVHYARLP